jgi:hypothetical protein
VFSDFFGMHMRFSLRLAYELLPGFQSLNPLSRQSDCGGIMLPKKKEVAISSEPVYKNPILKSPQKQKKPIKPKA